MGLSAGGRTFGGLIRGEFETLRIWWAYGADLPGGRYHRVLRYTIKHFLHSTLLAKIFTNAHLN